MDRLTFTRTMNKNGFEKISAQTVPGTYAEISHDSLLADQVDNRSSAQWKKAEIILCSGKWNGSLDSCIRGWRDLASQTQDQYLVIQDASGTYKIYNWAGREEHKTLNDIIREL